MIEEPVNKIIYRSHLNVFFCLFFSYIHILESFMNRDQYHNKVSDFLFENEQYLFSIASNLSN